MTTERLALAVALAVLSLGGCRSGTSDAPLSSASKQERLVLTGSSTVAPLLSEVAKRFESRNPGVRVDVQTGGSGRGITDVAEGLTDIGMSSRPLKSEEKSAGLRAHSIAKDGIGIILHAGNPVKALDRNQIVGIYTGTIRNWREVGGIDAPITVVNKAEGRATLELFLAYTGLEATGVKASVVIGDNQQGIKTVAGNPNAIGYVSIGAAEHGAANGVRIKLVSVDGVSASTATVADGTFPMARELFLITRGEPAGRAAELISYSRSSDVHDLVNAQFFVPLGPPGG